MPCVVAPPNDFELATGVACALAEIIGGPKRLVRVVMDAKIDWERCGTDAEEVIAWVRRHRERDAQRQVSRQIAAEQVDAAERAEYQRLKEKFGK